VVEAIAAKEQRVLILDTANRSSLPFLDADAVVEVPSSSTARAPDRSRSATCPGTRAPSSNRSRRSSA
jgi:alpha-galactosidase/6-phospho-beta-glucosidase family protein